MNQRAHVRNVLEVRPSVDTSEPSTFHMRRGRDAKREHFRRGSFLCAATRARACGAVKRHGQLTLAAGHARFFAEREAAIARENQRLLGAILNTFSEQVGARALLPSCCAMHTR